MKNWIAPLAALVLLSACGKKEVAPAPAPAPVVQTPAPAPAPEPPPAPEPASAVAAPVVAAPAAAPEAQAAAAKPAGHTVVKGDTLRRIGYKYGVSVTDLVKWNKLSNPNQIRLGQQLQLSAGGN